MYHSAGRPYPALNPGNLGQNVLRGYVYAYDFFLFPHTHRNRKTPRHPIMSASNSPKSGGPYFDFPRPIPKHFTTCTGPGNYPACPQRLPELLPVRNGARRRRFLTRIQMRCVHLPTSAAVVAVLLRRHHPPLRSSEAETRG